MNKWREHYKNNQRRTRNPTQNPLDPYRQIHQSLQQLHLDSIDEEVQSDEVSTSQRLNRNINSDTNNCNEEHSEGITDTDEQLPETNQSQAYNNNELNNRVIHGRINFYDWLSVVSYSFALTIVAALYFETRLFGATPTYSDETDYTGDELNTTRPNFLNNIELLNINSADTGDLLEGIIGNSDQRQESFLDRLDTLYIIILSVLTGYLEALRQHRA